MGAEIVLQVVRDLVPLGLENASSLLLAGSSAGGTGVMLNLDHVHNLVHHDLGKTNIFLLLLYHSIKILSIDFHHKRRLEAHRDKRRIRLRMVSRQGSVLAEWFITG